MEISFITVYVQHKKGLHFSIFRQLGGSKELFLKLLALNCLSVQFSLVQSLSHVRLFVTPWTAA